MANKALPEDALDLLAEAPGGNFATIMRNADILVVTGQEVGGEMSSLLAGFKTAKDGQVLTEKGSIKSVLTLGKMDQKIHVAVRGSLCSPGTALSSSDLTSGSVCLGLGRCNKGINWVRVRLCNTGKKLLLVSGHLPMDGKRTAEHNWDLGYGEAAAQWAAERRDVRAKTGAHQRRHPLALPRARSEPQHGVDTLPRRSHGVRRVGRQHHRRADGRSQLSVRARRGCGWAVSAPPVAGHVRLRPPARPQLRHGGRAAVPRHRFGYERGQRLARRARAGGPHPLHVPLRQEAGGGDGRDVRRLPQQCRRRLHRGGDACELVEARYLRRLQRHDEHPGDDVRLAGSLAPDVALRPHRDVGRHHGCDGDVDVLLERDDDAQK